MVNMDLKSRLRAELQDIVPYIPGKYMTDQVKLASNENNWGPSKKVVEELEIWSKKTQLYPYRGSEVIDALSEYVDVDSDCIFLGNGSDELIDLTFKVFKGDAAASYPSFLIYPLASKISAREFTSVSLDEDFNFDGGRFLKKAGDSDILFLCSPNNPTGLSISDDDLSKVLESGKVVVLDEAYSEFAGGSFVSWVRDYPNLIVLRTLAKAFALAGLRIGYGIAQKEIAGYFRKVSYPFNVSSLAQAAAVAALNDLDYMRDCVSKIVSDREKIYKALDSKFKAIPSKSNFVLADVSPAESEVVYDRLAELGFIIRRFGSFEGFDGDYVRVSAGTTDESSAFIEALESIDL
jgi:histidinol-phosphate aminotransferase